MATEGVERRSGTAVPTATAMQAEQPGAPLAPLVTVTGISGYLGSHITRQLLAQGYRVRGTVRALEKELAREHAAERKAEAKAPSPKRRKGLQSAAAARLEEVRTTFPTVELFQCNLEGGAKNFENAFSGATFVIHTACPHGTRAKDPQAQMVRPAVDGVKSVMRAARAARVKRVVLTSSCGAVQSNRVPNPRDYEWTEEDWNDDSTLAAAPYRYAKTLAERMAWQCTGDAAAPQKGKGKGKGKAKSFGPAVELVSICPAMVLGPPIYKLRKEGLSVRYMACILQGRFRTGAPGGPCFGVVDVRDAAAAHIKGMLSVARNPIAAAALESESEHDDPGAQRYIISSAAGVTAMEMVECIRSAESLEDCLWLPGCLPEAQVCATSYRPSYSTAKASQELGVALRPWQETIIDMAKALISLGIVVPPGASVAGAQPQEVPGASSKVVASPSKASPERSSSTKSAATAAAAAAVTAGKAAGGHESSRAGVTASPAAVVGAMASAATAGAASDKRTVYYWKQDEIDRLVAIVNEEGMGNWERKAMLLGTNRSAGSVEQKYHVIGRSTTSGDTYGGSAVAVAAATADNVMSGDGVAGAGGSGRPISKIGKWTEEEMGRLVAIVREKGLGSWEYVALALGTGRTSGAVEQKYYVVTREVAHTRPAGVTVGAAAGYGYGGTTTKFGQGVQGFR